jgi:GDP-4-dehydro-6-deoxy-D-mannose reductase
MIDSQSVKRVLITGVAGSGGSYLAEYIAENHPHVSIHGISRWHSVTSMQNLEGVKDRVSLYECDLMDMSSVFRVLEKVQPDVIFHLASHANVRAGFTTPLSVLNNNIMGTANLLEGIRLTKLDPVIQLCSTSEVYGQVPEKYVPILEDCPLSPVSPYAVSKVTQDLLGLSYFHSYSMKIVRTRMFAYINPRRGDLFATSFARQIAMIEKGLSDVLLHGNLESIRTLIDVRDAMAAYWDAVVYCQPGEAYNIGGETTISVGDFLELLKENSDIKIESKLDPNLLRPADVTLQIPCVEKFRKQTNWKPQFNFEDSVRFLLEHARKYGFNF